MLFFSRFQAALELTPLFFGKRLLSEQFLSCFQLVVGLVELTVSGTPGRPEFFGFLGLSRGLMLIIKNMIGISHVKGDNYEDEVEADNSSFESFFYDVEAGDADLRPPVIVGGGYEEV